MAATDPASRPNVTLLYLEKEEWFDEMLGDFLPQLKSKANVQEITTSTAATSIFSTSTEESSPSVVLIMDAGIARKRSSALLAQAAQYVQSGGTIIFAGFFSGFVTPPEFKKVFSTLGLPWESGNYHRTDFSLNPAAARNITTTGLAPVYSQKALHAANVAIDNAVYLPTSDSRIQSMVFAPDAVGDLSQTPAAFGASGQGKVGYIGDVNNERYTGPVVLAMCGLN